MLKNLTISGKVNFITEIIAIITGNSTYCRQRRLAVFCRIFSPAADSDTDLRMVPDAGKQKDKRKRKIKKWMAEGGIVCRNVYCKSSGSVHVNDIALCRSWSAD